MDDKGVFWFLSAEDRHKNAYISSDPNVHLLFQGSAYSDFLSLYGTTIVSRERKIIKKLWHPILKTWFTEGIGDPRITAIKVEAKEGYYREYKHRNAVPFAKAASRQLFKKQGPPNYLTRL